ncbi:uncharacterized protein N7459_005617 [Penicillium hispanicum]|uniref:uncharacterized protein n=1 Tax=Penicillium hispanicum TaxID=1080232 RepID=UPI002540911A|nr:uncharacterized protein N7459_005617 [Penicillium hispanicum]KAJ5579632.1 hypothetical protein N7459_005617 [Penicillium hispanicum]
MSIDRQACGEPIAIVGSGCRFPGDAISPSKLWELLKHPRDVLTEIPNSRFNSKAFYHPDGSHHGTTNVRHSYLLSEDHRLFDAQFFGTKPVEANSIDPQQRLLLETVYESLEAAGIPVERLQGSNTGVYVGLMTNDYADLLGRDVQSFPTYFASGTARSILSNRISYFFDWHGPSMTIDTACSSSLIALHQAVQSIRARESNVAVVAGTNLLLGPEQYIAESKLKMLSPTGRSRMWDKDADGYARGDGIAAVVLKPLSAALADGDHIECLIRETGINQDGRTKGITMPNPVAQADLIRDTYARAGLDLSKPSDRPQYFEAHGTVRKGTPAGDPVEAEAISTAFFGSKAKYHRKAGQEPPLYVGSIKTVIGHTEGTAGLAAVLKASLALQHAIVPPNLLLQELNPAVRPFYRDLQIISAPKDWPTLSDKTPRRASVNSFGFGGANAHAILEAYNPTVSYPAPSNSVIPIFTPFNFSASSEKSLAANIQAYLEYLKGQKDLELQDLSWTLNCRRSTLPVRLSVSASNVEDLAAKLEKASQNPSEFTPATKTSSVKHPKILGIFTGQGAQWASMGAELLRESPMASECITRLDSALQTLPQEERPLWSLRDEILKDSSSSRIGEALFSQTLCSAIQIMLVDLLRAAGVDFAAVVGHSSGEIAAAYASGYICADDAIKIAYYRGWSLQFSSDREGVKGAMMAAGTSLGDAKELCEMATLEGRICVAASNSSASVTLSGDADAIDEAREIFEDEKKFARLLKVDKAYHSHHMLPCAAPYIEAIQKCKIQIQNRSTSHPTWISSVYNEDIERVTDSLTDTYWSNNMINPVMFSQAVSFAVGALGPFDMALEVGPHPALKGPALQTIQDVSGHALPYSGTLSRGKNSREAFASLLGALWVSLGERAVDFAGFDKAVTRDARQPKLLNGLPSYSWDHDRIYWHESRISNTFRDGAAAFHPLLGAKCPDGTQKELRWRNYLHTREIPWLVHHQVQGQIVFPAAGYISAAVEMVAEQYGLNSIQLIDFQDVIIGQALVLEEGAGVEIIFALTITEIRDGLVSAVFNCYSDAHKGSSSMSLHASAQIKILLGESDHEALPPRHGAHDTFLELEAERFYNSVLDLGFGYTGPFNALSGLSRKMDEATGKIAVPEVESSEKGLLVHPASLDGAIQSIMLAYCFPGDGRLRTLYLPTKIDRIRINPMSCKSLAAPGSYLQFYSSVGEARFAELSGDVDIYSADGRYTVVQLQGLHTTPLTPLTSAMDFPMFTKFTSSPEEPTGRDINSALDWLPDCTPSLDLERVAHYYLKQLNLAIDESELSRIASHHVHLLSYANHCTSVVKAGKHPFARAEWANDKKHDIASILERNGETIDIKAMTTIGESLPSIVRGEKNLLETLMTDNMLRQFYAEAFGIQSYLKEAGRLAGQIANRFPHINVLEIGAGAGETTESVLEQMDTAFASYTYTDILDSQFDYAQDKFQSYQTRMAFKVLDIEKDVTDQGYGEESFDLVIASLALYATRNLEATLANVRRLLKPGGFLILLELTDPNVMRFGLVLGGLPGWWLGHSEGRTLSPCVPVERWSELMKKVGFSGVDTSVPHHPHLPVPFSVMVSQAVDERINFLRNPLEPSHPSLEVGSLTIIGGETPLTAALVSGIQSAIAGHYAHITVSPSLADIVLDQIPVMGTVLSLTELDGPTFTSLTPQKLKAFQELFKQSKNILWVGHGAQGDNPRANMFTGIQRTLAKEMIHLRIQFLNLYSLEEAKEDHISKKLLQFDAADSWEQQGQLQDLLWYTEPEMTLHNGKIEITRLRLNQERNDRYNSSKRLIVRTVDRNSAVVGVQKSEDCYNIVEAGIPHAPYFTDRVEIQVTRSLLRSVMVTETDQLFVVAGKDPQTENYVVTLSENLDSRTSVPSSWLIRCGKSQDEASRSMLSLYTHLLAESLVRKVAPGNTLAVLDPDFSIAAILTQYANQRGVQLVFFTTKEKSCSWPWVHFHRHSTRREILSKIPKNVTRLFNAGGDDAIGTILQDCLPADCQIDTEHSLTNDISQLTAISAMDQRVVSQLQASWTKVHGDHTPVNIHRLPSLSVKDLIETQPQNISQSIITWEDGRLPVQVYPATKVVKFAPNKTYWLVGLTSGLGRSLCQWMVRQGARYIALSSRSPKVDDDWVRQMASRGCTIRVFANDITNRESVRATHRQIVESMPPISGVAQGAMVLQDTMFFDLDLPRFEKVLQPKVQGSLLLDELFSQDTLDFMIFFSSMAAVTGNPGQIAYNAANMFMASLAAGRRKRGLAGHAINIGAIIGNGYVTRELNMGQQSYLYRVGHSLMSEQDFQEVFAEGVLSCLEKSAESQLCSGLRIDHDDTKNWVTNPIFQHLVLKSNNFIAGDKKSKAGVMVKVRLQDATSPSEVMDILQDAFILKLVSALQADPNKAIMDLSPDELGVDSLVAVDIRSWFLKELGVDIPVLKIFNAASIRDLLDFAASLLPESSIPNVKDEAEVDPKPQAKKPDPVPEIKPTAVETVQSAPVVQTEEERKVFNLDYIPTGNSGLGSSSTSLKAGDSSSELNEDTSSLSSVDNIIEVAEKREVQRTVPMSYGQSRFWFQKFFVEDQTAFNVTPTFELTGNLRIPDFARAVETIGQRHEALRTYFFVDSNKMPMQGVWGKSALQLEHIHIADKKEVEIAAKKMKAHVFNIADGEIIRFQLLSLAPNKHWLIIGFHHINMDGMSFEVLWSELESVYQGIPLSNETLQYPDFAMRQRREYQNGDWAEDLAYWRAQFAELPTAIPLLPFSLHTVRPPTSSFGAHYANMHFDRGLTEEIEECCRRFKVTPFHFYLAAWQTLLLRYFDTDSICIGLGDGNRTEADVVQSVGLFLNLLPIQFRRKPSQTFSEVLKDTKGVAQNTFAHSRVPFDVILTELNVPRSASHNPLFQVFFNYRPKVEESREFCGCVAQGSLFSGGSTSYDLHLDVVDSGSGEASVYLLAQKNLYAPEHGEMMLRSYYNLVRAFLQNPAARVEWPALFLKSDIEEALIAGRGPECESAWPATPVHRVDNISGLYPDRIALKTEDGVELTYSQLQMRVGSIARELANKNVGPGSRIGVFQTPTADWICSLLAIWRVGATYIPFDRKVGIDRLAVIAQESSPSIVLINSMTPSDFAKLHSSAQPLDVTNLAPVEQGSVLTLAEPSQTAVVMYTSGSTGVPKGIAINQSTYVSHIEGFSRTWKIAEAKETILHQSSYAWDMSMYQILISLCNGGTLVIANDKTRGDPVATSKLIAAEKVTFTCATPTEYLAWIRHGRDNLKQSIWTTAISGGEFLSPGMIEEFKSLGNTKLRLINAYGPAEVTMACSASVVPYAQIDSQSQNPLALRTLPNYSVYVLDENLQLVPLGMPGEVVVGGAGIAQGYLDNDRTKERFLPDPYASAFMKSHGWSTLHRTGDRGRLTQDGGLVLLGRIDGDNQIKLGGIRINVEEIESAIVQTSGGSISQAVVSARDTGKMDDVQTFLVAFIVFANSTSNQDSQGFLERLMNDLPVPQYMRPAAFIPMDSIPQNNSGKIDRASVNRLPIPKQLSQRTDQENLAPLEESLRQLWKETIPPEVMSLYNVNSQSDFFHVGGGSITLVNLQALIQDRLGVSVPLHQLFGASTLQGMAYRIRNQSSIHDEPAVDWDEEISTMLTSTDMTADIDTHRTPSGAGIVVLTGATGFIGKEILRNLANDDKIHIIHCVAVRKPLAQLPAIFAHHKVRVHQGNLGAPQLGLSNADASWIFSQADIVIHNGADVSFMKTYQSLRLTNVASTQELVKLALPRRIPFHFISSASVTRLASQKSFGEASVGPYPPPSIPNDGYTAAKWVCEVYLERASQQLGLPVWIHRPSSVTGPDAPELDLMDNMMRYCQKIRKIPDSNSWSGVFDLISVQSVATQIVEAVHSSGTRAPGADRIRHMYEAGEIQLGQDEVQSLMATGTGETFQMVPVDEWVEGAEAAGMSPLLGMYLRKASDGQVLLPKLVKGGRGTA